MALTQDAKINVAVTGIQQLDKLQNTLSTTISKFGGLKTVLAGVGFANAARGALAMSDELDDLAKSSGIAIGRLVELKKALSISGGQADQMATGVNNFIRSIDEAAQGSLKAQNSFNELGISLTDLATLSEQDLLIKTLDGIAAIDDKGRQATLMMDKFGKSFKNVDARGLADSLRGAAGSGDAYARSIERAAKLSDDLAIASGNIKLAFLEAFSGVIQVITDVSDRITKSKEAFETLVTVIKAVGIALVIAFSFTVFGTIIRFVGIIGRGLFAIYKSFGAIATGAQGAVASIVGGFGPQSLLMKGLRGIAGLLSVILGAVSGFTLFGSSAEDAGEKVDETGKKVDRVVDRTQYDNAVKGIQAMGDAFDANNKKLSDQLALDAALIGKDKETADLMKAQADLTRRTNEEIQKLTDAKAKMSKEERDAGLAGVYDQQIQKVTELASVESNRIAQAIQNTNKLEAVQQLALFGIKSRIDLENELMDVQHRIATGTMNEIEKKYADIDFAAKKSAKSAIEAEEARIGRRLNSEEAKKYYDTAIAGAEELKQINAEEYETSRQFSTGWAKAFNEYADNATNAAKRAEAIFSKVMGGMEDLIVNFAKTGKFEWKNFVNMMLEELLRAQIQSIFAKMLGTMSGSMRGGRSGGGGLTGMLGGLFGGGGGAGGGGGSILGKLGGAIAGGASKLFGGLFGSDTSAQQGPTPDGGNLSGNTGGIFTNLGKSVGNLFSGLFANGGTIPQGRFGIVGEAGPEFVGGPATVTPMGTNVTYNINAVDAQSFKAMIARDPQFLYAVTMQGAKSVPGAR